MKPENVTPDIVKGVYQIFRHYCKPNGSVLLEENYPPKEISRQINIESNEGIELRVTSKYSPSPKLCFISRDGNLEAHFIPNLYQHEIPNYPQADTIRNEFYRAVKSYFKKMSRR